VTVQEHTATNGSVGKSLTPNHYWLGFVNLLFGELCQLHHLSKELCLRKSTGSHYTPWER